MDNLFTLFIVFVFIASFFAIEASRHWWQKKYGAEAKRLRERLEKIADNDIGNVNYAPLNILKARYADQSNPIAKILLQFPIGLKLDQLIMQSGVVISLSNFVKYSGYFAIGTIAIALLAGCDFLTLVVATILTTLIPTAYLLIKKQKRLQKFERQLPDAIDSLCRSLRAGHAFSSAFALVGDEFAEPVASEFRIAIEEVNLGVGMNEALTNMTQRIPLTDLKFFVIAVMIQRETGGNLSEILGNISKVMRERFKLQNHIKTLSAEGRMSAWILGSMPGLMVLVLSAINPKYSDTLFHTETGQSLVKYSVILIIFAAIWMRNILKVRM